MTGIGVFVGGPGGCIGIPIVGFVGFIAGGGAAIGIGGIPIGGCPPIIGIGAGPERLMMIGRTGIVAMV